jgi:hypothetical protein
MKKRISNSVYGFRSLAIVFSMFFIFSLSSFNSYQSVNFSGTWVLNETKSVLGEGGFGGAKNMTVTHNGNNLSVERTNTGRNGQTMSNTLKYTLDGKANENKMGRGSSTSVSKLSADGKSMNINSTMMMERNGNKMEVKSLEVWKLSSDGKTLTIENTGTTPRGERKTTLVYDKK